MKIKFNNRRGKLDIVKNKRIQSIIIKNYRPDLKYDFPSGAIKMLTYQASKKYFTDLVDFYLHLMALRYLNYINYNLPNSFFEKSYEFEELDKDRFIYFAQGYLDGFKGLSEDNLWKQQLEIKNYQKGYRLIHESNEFVLIGESSEDYFSFMYQSID